MPNVSAIRKNTASTIKLLNTIPKAQPAILSALLARLIRKCVCLGSLPTGSFMFELPAKYGS